MTKRVGLVLLLLIVVLAYGWFGVGTGDNADVATYALAVFAPVPVTRHTWPTHYLMTLPVLAVVAWLAPRGERPARRALIYFVVGTLLFYIAHIEGLRIVGGAGPLLLASVLVVVMATCALFRRPA